MILCFPLLVASAPADSQGLLGDERRASIEDLHRQATQAAWWRNVEKKRGLKLPGAAGGQTGYSCLTEKCLTKTSVPSGWLY